MASKNQTKLTPLTTGLLIIIGVMFVMLTVISTNYETVIESSAAGKGGPTYSGGSIKLNEDPADLTLGSSVSFTTVAPKLKGSEYPMVYVACYQGDELVYGQLDHPSVAFTLGGGWSKWRELGGAATCKATLFAYGGKEKGISTISLLAETPEFPTN